MRITWVAQKRAREMRTFIQRTPHYCTIIRMHAGFSGFTSFGFPIKCKVQSAAGSVTLLVREIIRIMDNLVDETDGVHATSIMLLRNASRMFVMIRQLENKLTIINGEMYMEYQLVIQHMWVPTCDSTFITIESLIILFKIVSFVQELAEVSWNRLSNSWSCRWPNCNMVLSSWISMWRTLPQRPMKNEYPITYAVLLIILIPSLMTVCFCYRL